MTEQSLPQLQPSDIDVFVAAPASPEQVTPAFMVGVFRNLLEKNPDAEPRLRGNWENRLAYWQRVMTTDAEVQREGWAVVRRGLGLDDGVRR